MEEKVRFIIDGKEICVQKGTTVYAATQAMGIDIPIFCYQDRMPPFGACRVCLVEVEKMNKLQTSCTLVATEGMVVNTQSQKAVEGRKGILELLLINHPLDCPICDKGGECPLQDLTLKFGPGESKFFEEKRKFAKAKLLSPVLMLDRERCIVCARCTRFGDLVAGDHALEFIERGFKTEVGTCQGRAAESKFIGNTIMICPVGALTSDVYRFKARPWDNHFTASTCTLCPVGCSLVLDSRDGEIVRTRSCENKEVNDIWLCDKGWFGYEFSSSVERIQKPLLRKGGQLALASWEEAFCFIADKMIAAKPQGKLAAWGGAPLTVEENYLFQKLMREGASSDNLDYRIGQPLFGLEEEGIAPGMEISIGDIEELDFVYLLGIDLTEEFPVIWLRLKQAINKGAKVTFLGHFIPEIAPYMDTCIVHPPGKEQKLLEEQFSFFKKKAEKGKGALFVGRQYLASKNRKAILSDLIKWQNAGSVSLNILEGSGNSMGSRWAGMHPELAPLGKRLANPGLNYLQVFEKMQRAKWDFLYVAGADPARKFASSLWDSARKNIGCLVVQELFLTKTALQADVVLPVLSFVEKQGTFINIERRLTGLFPGKKRPETLLSDGEIFIAVAKKLGLQLSLDPYFIKSLEREEGGKLALTSKPAYLASAPYKLSSLKNKIPLDRPEAIESISKEEPDTGLLATFAKFLFDEGTRMQHNAHLFQLVKEPFIRLRPEEGKKRGLKTGDKVTVRAHFCEFEGRIALDEGVAEKTAVLPLGFKQLETYQLEDLFNGMAIEIEKGE